MYDISIIMPVCDLTKYYFRRFLDLKKYCALNSEGRTIRWKLLVGPGEDFYGMNLKEGWPSNMTIEIVDTPYLEPAQKITYYYTQMTDEEIMSAKWHMKIDDDTATDIGKLMYYLEDELDYNDRLYLSTELRREVERVEDEILTEMGYGRWIKEERIIHEWEGCIVSQAGMMAIQKNQEAQTYLKKRMERKGGYGDQPVAIAIKFCKVLPINPMYLSVWGKPGLFSMFGGPFVHIHFFLSRSEMSNRCLEFFKALIDKAENTHMKNQLLDRYYSLFRKDCWNDMRFKLCDNHHVVGKNHTTGKESKIGMWIAYKQNVLGIVIDDLPSTIFEFKTKDAEFKNLEGFCIESNTTMTMREIAGMDDE